MTEWPKKLKVDCILEALLELRFDSKELPEIVVGRLVDYPEWSRYDRKRLPISDIPAPVRLSDQNLRYQPLLELRRSDGGRVAKIGSNVVSYHVPKPYIGWAEFRKELTLAIEFVSGRFPNLQVKRLGLRYINAIDPKLHGIAGIESLNIAVSINREVISSRLNINFSKNVAGDIEVMTRIAPPEFVEGPLPIGTSCFIDVDVFTPKLPGVQNAADIVAWIDRAHDVEKDAFFSLIPAATLNQLKEE
jgi:uncharacterized protein (TIGR04255 family)